MKFSGVAQNCGIKMKHKYCESVIGKSLLQPCPHPGEQAQKENILMAIMLN